MRRLPWHAAPRRGASITSLLLVITVIAVCLAVIRQALVEASPVPNLDPSYPVSRADMVIALVIFSGLMTGCFTIGLAIWSRWGWWRGPASVLLGACLGAAAAAQSTRVVDWRVIAGMPLVLILGALFLAQRCVASRQVDPLTAGEAVWGDTAAEVSCKGEGLTADRTASATLAQTPTEA